MSAPHGMSLVQALAIIRDYTHCLARFEALRHEDVVGLCGLFSEDLFRFCAGKILQDVIDMIERDPQLLALASVQPLKYSPTMVRPAPMTIQNSLESADSTFPRQDSRSSSASHSASATAPLGVKETSRNEAPPCVNVFMPASSPSAWSRLTSAISTGLSSFTDRIGPAAKCRSVSAKAWRCFMVEALPYIALGALITWIMKLWAGAAQ